MMKKRRILKFIASQETWGIRYKYLLFFALFTILEKTNLREVRKNEIQGAVSDDAYPLM
jgi:hypothetical protein